MSFLCYSGIFIHVPVPNDIYANEMCVRPRSHVLPQQTPPL